MTSYRVGNRIIDLDQEGSAERLVELHATRTRLLCLCSDPPGEMYLARGSHGILVKRMPNTGSRHAADCGSYEAPPGISGLGEVLGSAIREDPETGNTALSCAFSLSKGRTRATPISDSGDPDSVASDTRRLGLRALLHYLWDEAGLTRWRPAMRGKRNWAIVHHYLLDAAASKTVKRASLAQQLFIPEPFSVDCKDQIQHRRRLALASLSAPANGHARRLMVIIAEVKEVSPARYGHKLVLRHLPDFHFMLTDEIHRRMLAAFAAEIDLWNAVSGTHLIVVGTFSVGSAGYASMEELALMSVDENWLPFSSSEEKRLSDILVSQGRSFVRSLRYNLAPSRPLAFAILSDTKPEPFVLYLVPMDADAAYEVALRDLVASSKLPSWTWMPHQAGAATLPQKYFSDSNHLSKEGSPDAGPQFVSSR